MVTTASTRVLPIMSSDGSLVRTSVSTGATIWRKSLPPVATRVTIGDGTAVLVAGGKAGAGTVAALGLKVGSVASGRRVG